MTRSELIQYVYNQTSGVTPSQIERGVELIFNEISHTLSAGGRVELRGFGVFTVRKREPRAGRNPRTGRSVDVGEKFVPFFKAGKTLRQRLNQQA